MLQELNRTMELIILLDLEQLTKDPKSFFGTQSMKVKFQALISLWTINKPPNFLRILLYDVLSKNLNSQNTLLSINFILIHTILFFLGRIWVIILENLIGEVGRQFSNPCFVIWLVLTSSYGTNFRITIFRTNRFFDVNDNLKEV